MNCLSLWRGDLPGVEIGEAPLLEIRDLSTTRLRNIDLSVWPGEVVGLAGLVGSGRSAVMRAVFGIDERTGGEIRVGGSKVDIKEPKDAMRAGIALIPEDHRGHAIVPMMSVEQNFGLANQKRFSRFGVLRGRPIGGRRKNMLRIFRSDRRTSRPRWPTSGRKPAEGRSRSSAVDRSQDPRA